MQLELARKIADGAVAHAQKMGIFSLAIVILDAGGNIKYSLAQDNAGSLRHSIALAKANAAIGMGMSTGQLFEIFENGILPDRFSAAISALSPQGFAPQPGGELVNQHGRLVGAVGISGASSLQDESVARAAIDQAIRAV
ncbi:heme-binding protein [Cognatishimia sp. WU-CL00825]|uniref:GlcG/HbpS family heme-binding protein n=1 Tax=Cognatishimia sp. WU-CL00825 TaxID=3127658 RepID=UPI00310BD40D